jgi:SAM-dependent methyltransferase
MSPGNTQASYDAVADEYTRRIANELENKPFDRELLDRFAREVAGRGPVCDLGCGPGHVTRYLHERGVDVFGLDLSLAMVVEAQRLNPAIPFHQGDMHALDAPDAAWAGIAALYSLIHIPRAEQVGVLRELRRVLMPGGLLLLSFHIGDEVRHLDDWWGRPVSVDFIFFEPAEMTGYLQAAGFTIVDTLLRPPYPAVEAQTERAYLLARKT